MNRPDESERRWSTFAGRHRILVLARTFTSAVRAVEALDVLRGDLRLEFQFCFDGSSAFHRGVGELLDRLEVPLVSWDHAIASEYALVITASENVDLTSFTAPVVVLPHGVGFQKNVPDSRSDERRLSGVVRPESQESGNVRLVLSHPDQRAQLEAVRHHLLAKNAEVIGDLAFDRMRAGLRLRGHYRDALGMLPEQRLVVFASTWGEQSALGVHETLPARLLAALPADGYRVAAVLHPNIWFRYGPWQVRHWLSTALDAGLLLIPPSSGWGATLAAADCVVGDHSSMAVYAAGLDHPLLIAAFGHEVVPGTAASRLGAQAPRLDPAADLHAQIERTIAEHTPGRHADVAGRAFAHIGESARRFAALCYRLLGLPAPAHCVAVRALDSPVPDHQRPALAFEVRSQLADDGVVHVARYPAAVRPFDEEPAALRHLCAADTEPDQRFVENASVIYRASAVRDGESGTGRATGGTAAGDRASGDGVSDGRASGDRPPAVSPDPQRELRRLLDLHPGALLAAVPADGGCDCLLRDGRSVRVRAAHTAIPVLTGLVYTLLREGRLATGDHRVQVEGTAAPRAVRVHCEAPPGARP